jgi:hypothetical protein
VKLGEHQVKNYVPVHPTAQGIETLHRSPLFRTTPLDFPLGDPRNRSATSSASESVHRKGMQRRPILEKEGTKGQAHILSDEQAVEVEAGPSLETSKAAPDETAPDAAANLAAILQHFREQRRNIVREVEDDNAECARPRLLTLTIACATTSDLG